MQTVSDSGLLDEFRNAKQTAVLGSIVYLLILLGSWLLIHGSLAGLAESLFTVQVGPWIVYAFGGGAIVGAVLAISIVQYRLVAPVVAVIAIFCLMMYQMWQVLQEPYVLLPGTPYDIFLVGWPVLLGLAVAVGVIEKRVRG